MMCATPLEAMLSAPTTVLKSLPSGLTNTPLRVLYTCTLLPSTVLTLWKYFKSVDRTSAGSTWKLRMSTNVSLFSGFRRVSRVPSGKAAKPSLVGAKTVNGPAEVNVSTKSPATTAATRVERSGTDWANSTMLGKASTSPAGGNKTPSMMWATPLEALLSAPTTVLKSLPSGLTNTPLRVLYTCTLLPSTVATLWKYFKSVDRTWDGSTWKVRMSTNVSLFSGFRRVSRVPSGKAAKPSLVGAKTVNGPAEANVSTKSPATTAATRVEHFMYHA